MGLLWLLSTLQAIVSSTACACAVKLIGFCYRKKYNGAFTFQAEILHDM